jgi:uncharacterized RDD family membrane protein YckC
VDGEQHRDAQAWLESDYLAGAISAEEYMRLWRQLHVGVSEAGTDAPMAEVRLASWGRRAAAFLLDGLLLIGVFVATSVLASATAGLGGLEAVWGLEILFLPSLYQWFMVGAWGQTLGKMALRVRVVRGEDAGRVGYPRALGRVASTWALGFFVVPLLLAFLWPLWDKRNQTLYDKMVNTIVVRVG